MQATAEACQFADEFPQCDHHGVLAVCVLDLAAAVVLLGLPAAREGLRAAGLRFPSPADQLRILAESVGGSQALEAMVGSCAAWVPKTFHAVRSLSRHPLKRRYPRVFFDEIEVDGE